MKKEFIFIDESGSPDFFGKRKRPLWLEGNFQPILIIGMLQTDKRTKLRKTVEGFQREMLNDKLYNSIHSVSMPGWFLHAKDDHPEVRASFVNCIRQMTDVKCSVIVARKIPEIFTKKHNGNASEFYFDVLHHLVKRKDFAQNTHYALYLAKREKRKTIAFQEAVKKAVSSMKAPPYEYSCNIVKAADCPEVSVLDYMLWAIQRYILRGERRFLTVLEDKLEFIYDIYDSEASNNFYDKNNRFLLEKTTPFNIK